MEIYVDADACPVVSIVETIGKKYDIKVTLLCDRSHILSSDYSTIKVVEGGKDAVDFALLPMCKEGDLIVTQDYGVAAMVLGKRAIAIHPSGKQYTEDNIDQMLMQRHIAQKERRKGKYKGKGAKKRTKDNDLRFEQSFIKIIENEIKKNET